jgi:hypothetical protein
MPLALIQITTVVNSPRSADVREPTCFLPLAAIIFDGRDWTVDENEEEEDQLYVGTIRINKIGMKQKEKDSWYEQIEVEGQKVKIKLDTGADTNLIPLKIFQKRSHPQKLLKTRINLEAYGGYKLKVVGKAELECKIHNKESRQTFS